MKNIRFPLSLSQGGEMNPGNKHDREFINAGCWGWVPAGSRTETKSQNINKKQISSDKGTTIVFYTPTASFFLFSWRRIFYI